MELKACSYGLIHIKNAPSPTGTSEYASEGTQNPIQTFYHRCGWVSQRAAVPKQLFCSCQLDFARMDRIGRNGRIVHLMAAQRASETVVDIPVVRFVRAH